MSCETVTGRSWPARRRARKPSGGVEHHLASCTACARWSCRRLEATRRIVARTSPRPIRGRAARFGDPWSRVVADVPGFAHGAERQPSDASGPGVGGDAPLIAGLGGRVGRLRARCRTALLASRRVRR